MFPVQEVILHISITSQSDCWFLKKGLEGSFEMEQGPHGGKKFENSLNFLQFVSQIWLFANNLALDWIMFESRFEFV